MARWLSNATTIAGSKISDFIDPSTQLYMPYDVWLDNDDTFYVLDTYNYRVQKFTSNSTTGVTIISGDYGSELNQFISSRFSAIKINSV